MFHSLSNFSNSEVSKDFLLLMKAALEEWADCFNDEDIRLHDIRIEDVYNLTNDLLNKMED